MAALNFQVRSAAVGLVSRDHPGRPLARLSRQPARHSPCCLVLSAWSSWSLGIIFGVIAGMKANEGQVYKYPVSLNIFK